MKRRYDTESPKVKELLSSEEKIEASASMLKSSLSNLTNFLTVFASHFTAEQDKIKDELEALSNLPQILELYYPRREMDEKMDKLTEKLEAWQIGYAAHKAALSEKLRQAETQSGEEGRIAFNQAKDLSEEYQSSNSIAQAQLTEEIKDYTKFIRKEKLKQEERLRKVSQKMNELVKEVKLMENEIKAKNAVYEFLLQKEQSHVAVPLNTSEPIVLNLDTTYNEWLSCDIRNRDTKKVKIETTVPKYSHLVRAGNNMYITGGIDACSRVLSTGHKFDLAVDITKGLPIANMLYPKKCHTLVEVDKHTILSIGGENDTFTIKKCEVYDLDENVWEEMPPLNQGKKYVTGCTFKGEAIYAFGGVVGRYSVDTIEKISLPLTKWSKWELVELAKDSPKIYSAGAYPLNDSILIFGGNSEKVYTFVPETSTLIPQTILDDTCGFRASTCAVTDGKLGAIGSNKQLLEISVTDFRGYISKLEGVSVTCYKSSIYYEAPRTNIITPL